MKKMNIKERTSKKIDDWKKDVKHLEHQLGQSKEEAKVLFEKQKSKLLEWTDEMKKEVDKLEGFGEEKAKSLKANLEELRVQAALGKAEANDALQERQKQLNQSIHQTKLAVSKLEDTASKDAKLVLNKANDTLDNFYTQFDLFRLQLELGKKEAAQNWEDRKKEISMRLSKMKSKIGKAQEESADRWEHFSEEISEAWNHVKKAFTD